jgi:hypothetical protein
MQAGKTGILRCFEDIQRETAVYIQVGDKRILQQREYLESDLASDDPDAPDTNEIIDRRAITPRNPAAAAAIPKAARQTPASTLSGCTARLPRLSPTTNGQTAWN